MIDKNKLIFWIDNNYNVLLIGRHGIGKTSIIKEVFNEKQIKWKYFSAATMDPWVDFIGVPKEVKDEQTGKVYLDLVRPKEFADDEVEAIFMDEFNRCHKKISNSIMELLQFKSINGKKFTKLRFVWACINPFSEDSDDYNVEKMDEAIKDRFQIIYELPYKLHQPYFKQKYGDQLASSVSSWWYDLPEEIRKQISPRRLDYAIDVYTKNGDITDVLPKNCNVAEFIKNIKYGTPKTVYNNLVNQTPEEVKKYFQNNSNVDFVLDIILAKKNYSLLQYVDEEKLTSLLCKDAVLNKIKGQIGSLYTQHTNFKNSIDSLIVTNKKYGKIFEPLIPKKPVSQIVITKSKVIKYNNRHTTYEKINNLRANIMFLDKAIANKDTTYIEDTLEFLSHVVLSLQCGTITGKIGFAPIADVINKINAYLTSNNLKQDSIVKDSILRLQKSTTRVGFTDTTYITAVNTIKTI